MVDRYSMGKTGIGSLFLNADIVDLWYSALLSSTRSHLSSLESYSIDVSASAPPFIGGIGSPVPWNDPLHRVSTRGNQIVRFTG